MGRNTTSLQGTSEQNISRNFGGLYTHSNSSDGGSFWVRAQLFFEISQVAELVCLPDCDSLEDQKLNPVSREKETSRSIGCRVGKIQEMRKSAFFKWWIICTPWHDAVQDHFLWLRFQCVNVLWGEGLLPEHLRGLWKKLGTKCSKLRIFLKIKKSFIVDL